MILFQYSGTEKVFEYSDVNRILVAIATKYVTMG